MQRKFTFKLNCTLRSVDKFMKKCMCFTRKYVVWDAEIGILGTVVRSVVCDKLKNALMSLKKKSLA